MSNFFEIERLVRSICARSPASCTIGMHIRMTAPDFMFRHSPAGWNTVYAERGYVMLDPRVHWGLSNTGCRPYSEFEADDPHGMIELSKSYGLTYGIMISVEGGGTRSLAGYARSDRDYDPAECESLVADTQKLHDLTQTNESMSEKLRSQLTELAEDLDQNG